MKILLAGDSWAWSWMAPGYLFRSKEFNSKIDDPYEHEVLGNFPQISVLLSHFGHSSDIIALPANSNSTQLASISKHLITNDYDMIWYFFTHPTRDFLDPGKGERKDDTKSFSESDFYDLYHSCSVSSVQLLGKISKLYKIPVLIAGGCGKLYQEDFNKACNSNYLHLVTESIIEEFTFYRQNKYTLSSWKVLIEEGFIDNLAFANKIIQEHDHYDRAIADQDTGLLNFFWPDTGHPGITGQTLIVDMFFKYIEDNQLTPDGS